MATMVGTPVSLAIEFMPSSVYEARLPAAEDPFRHQSGCNSHNHHEHHPWGPEVQPGTPQFDALYAQANNQYMYHLWYTPALAPFMATELIHIEPLSRNLIDELANLSRIHLDSGIESAMSSAAGQSMVAAIQAILDKAGVKMDDQLFIRLGATSAKDSFALNVPTTKPTQLPPKSDIILRRILTSGRTVGRILALSEHIWPADPGEAMIIQRWSPQVELASEFRVFCYEGRVTAISQDIWWEKLGWRERYSDGLVQAITKVWESTKDFLPFKTCTMDVLVTPPDTNRAQWTAGIIEFNGFGAHLNTGSDLFHWINDADILQGRQSGITIRFVDDWEEDGAVESGRAKQSEIVSIQVEEQIEEDAEPDWFALEKKLKSQYGQLSNAATKLSLAKAAKLPLRGRWCSAY